MLMNTWLIWMTLCKWLLQRWLRQQVKRLYFKQTTAYALGLPAGEEIKSWMECFCPVKLSQWRCWYVSSVLLLKPSYQVCSHVSWRSPGFFCTCVCEHQRKWMCVWEERRDGQEMAKVRLRSDSTQCRRQTMELTWHWHIYPFEMKYLLNYYFWLDKQGRDSGKCIICGADCSVTD